VRGAGPGRGVVFQAPCLLPWLSAFDNVMLGVDQVFPDAPRSQRRQIVEHYLETGRPGAINAKDASRAFTGDAAARRHRTGVLALSPKMLLLDEPFGMLDSLTRLELQEILLAVWREKKITGADGHPDVDEALFLSDRIAMMTAPRRPRWGIFCRFPSLGHAKSAGGAGPSGLLQTARAFDRIFWRGRSIAASRSKTAREPEPISGGLLVPA